MTMLLIMLITAILSGVKIEYIIGQIVFHACTYWALSILSNRPIINPIQTVVFLFYWWFGAAPIVMGLFYFLQGNIPLAVGGQESGMEALWIVAIGLPLYSYAANFVMHRLEASNSHAAFLMPSGDQYLPRTLLRYFLIGAVAALSIELLDLVGLRGIESVNFLGGTKTTVWWVGILKAVSDILKLATVGIIVSITVDRKSVPIWLIWLGIIIVLQTLFSALTSGSKSAFVIIVFYVLCAKASKSQKPPWGLIIGLVFCYLVIIEPFVTTTRMIAQMSGAETARDRQEVFSQGLKGYSSNSFNEDREIQIGSIFRGIYSLAGSITRSNSWFEGYWNGLTIGWGLIVNFPRAIFPNKPDADIGNYFARTVGVATGISTEDNYDFNIALTIPFEIVGNYGWIAGILSFPLLGFIWSFICSVLLSAKRISNHPLSPYFCFLALTFESPFGNVLAQFRDLIFPLVVLRIMWEKGRTL